MTDTNNLNCEIIEWGRTYLSSHGYILKNDLPENVKVTPWSEVVRFSTSDGDIYLKHTPELLGLEPVITQILHTQFHASVPVVIAQNTELNCFLMKDAGEPLREILKKQFDTALFSKAIEQFTTMQLAVAEHVTVFLDMGVLDWRLEKLPELYMLLLTRKEILIADGLSETEISELEKLLPKVSNLCKKLSDYAIKQTLVQPDFHDNNILIAETSKNITFIDLGEAVISHPFFSLVNCMLQIKKHHALTENDDRYIQLLDACLKNYLIFESKKYLLDAFALARKLLFIYGALADYRLMNACDKSKFTGPFKRHGRPGVSLKEFLNLNIEID